MRPHPPQLDPEVLLAQTRWVRSLALSLVADPDQADDLAQETFLRALRHRPSAGDAPSLRGWLSTVLRNLVRERSRSTHRRTERERASAPGEATASTLELVERVAAHRALVDAVMALREPYREVVVRRFFDEQKPARIATEVGVPVSTVKTRLDRALKQLRARYESAEDGSGAGGRAGLMALTPLLPPRFLAGAPAHGATALAPTLTGAIAMTTPLKILVASTAALATTGLLLYWSGDGVSTEAAAAPRAEEQTVERPPAEVEAIAFEPATRETIDEPAASAPTSVPASAPAPEPGAPPAPVVGQVFDADGHAAVGVELLFRGTDGEEARTTSARGGTFRFEHAAAPGSIRAASPELVTIIEGTVRTRRTGPGTTPGATNGGSTPPEVPPAVVVAPRHPLAGLVHDASGRPLADADVRLVMPASFRTRFSVPLDRALQPEVRCTSDATGRFALEGAPRVAGARFEVRLEGYRPHVVPEPALPQAAMDITLERIALEERTLRGIVVDPDGQPVPDARVVLGVEPTRTDEHGEFRFDLSAARPENERLAGRLGPKLQRLLAVHPGHQPARRDIAVSEEDGTPAWPDFVVLELGAPPLSIAGRVVDAAGAPIAAAQVWIADATVFAMTDDGPVLAEGVLSGRDTDRRLGVETDAGGRFRIPGLTDRTYRLVAGDDSTMVQTRPVPAAAGSEDVELVLDTGDVHERIAGRVVTRSGAPVAGVHVIPVNDGYRLHVEGQLIGTSHGALESVQTDEDGRFEIFGVPRYLAYLRCYGPEIVPVDFGRDEQGLEELGRSGLDSLELVVARRARVRLELAPERADELAILDPAGNEMTIRIVLGTSSRDGRRVPILEGRTEVLTVQDDATTVVLFKEGNEVERVPVSLEPGDVNVLQL